MIAILLCAMMGGWLDGRVQASDFVKAMNDLEPLKGTARMARVNELGSKIRDQSEETVTQTYLGLRKPEQRHNMLSTIGAAAASDCRYVPLLLTVVQFDEDANARSKAAIILSEKRPFPGPVRESAIVLELGEALMREENKYTADNMASALASFLKKTCKVDIGATRDTGKTTTMLGQRMVIQKTSVDDVKNWWTKEGRTKALARAFDVSKPSP